MPNEFEHPKNVSPIWRKATKNSVKRWQRNVIVFLVLSLFASLAIIGFTGSYDKSEAVLESDMQGAKINESENTFPIVKDTCRKWQDLMQRSKKMDLTMEQMTFAITEINNLAQTSRSSILKISTEKLENAILAEDIDRFKQAIPTLNQICQKVWAK